ncbi:MAG: PrsW family intramembrane metalloprotease, partial [Methanosarcinales archaeon]|nr:PrsW family intramembrane metalloprotease [Methanosarcinales archaeon]
FILGLIAVSFSYMLELMFIVMLFNIPLPYSVFLMIFLAALTEEFFKSIGIYSLFARSVMPRNLKNAGLCALLAGIGFFVGEKFLLILTLAPISDSVFGAVISMGELLIFPLLLHIGSTAIVSVGLVRWPKRYFLLLMSAAIAHSLYNLFMLRGLLFG